MNSDIIPVGRCEMVTGPATITNEVMIATALSACALTAVVFRNPMAPANAAVVTAFATFPINAQLFNVASMTVTTGTMYLIYRV